MLRTRLKKANREESLTRLLEALKRNQQQAAATADGQVVRGASSLPHPHAQYTLSLTTCIKYCPYPFFNIGRAWRSSCSALIQPARKAISSGQANLRPSRLFFQEATLHARAGIQGLRTSSPAMPVKSAVLQVTSVARCSSAKAAIWASAWPMGRPARLRWALTTAYM